MIVIASATSDLHAEAVKASICANGGRCHIIEIDQIAQSDSLNYTIGVPGRDLGEVRASDGDRIRLSDARVIWLRRMRGNQMLRFPVSASDGYEIINNDCRGALAALFLTKFQGKWLSHPDASYRASDKLYQLDIAQRCGFRIPRTLVAQNRDAVVAFSDECGGNIIVKTVVGVHEPFLQTVRFDHKAYVTDDFETCPAIYQECIEGTRHLRLLCTREWSLGAMIETGDLDWRVNLNAKMTFYAADDGLHSMIMNVFAALDLEMGVVDIKVTEEGEYVWFEVNPQGQFLFMQPLTGFDFVRKFSDFLVSQTLV